eukprot:10765349-Lingulodinium_polyedra.AAC.1
MAPPGRRRRPSPSHVQPSLAAVARKAAAGPRTRARLGAPSRPTARAPPSSAAMRRPGSIQPCQMARAKAWMGSTCAAKAGSSRVPPRAAKALSAASA